MNDKRSRSSRHWRRRGRHHDHGSSGQAWSESGVAQAKAKATAWHGKRPWLPQAVLPRNPRCPGPGPWLERMGSRATRGFHEADPGGEAYPCDADSAARCGAVEGAEGMACLWDFL
jgi:hypothetical protein